MIIIATACQRSLVFLNMDYLKMDKYFWTYSKQQQENFIPACYIVTNNNTIQIRIKALIVSQRDYLDILDIR